jgi:hypothetical protein
MRYKKGQKPLSFPPAAKAPQSLANAPVNPKLMPEKIRDAAGNRVRRMKMK